MKIIIREMMTLKKIFVFISVIIVMTLSLTFYCFAEDRRATNFTIAPCFSDNMVLQQNEPIRVWGTSTDEGGIITVELGKTQNQAVVKDGKWETTLAPRSYTNVPQVLKLSGNDTCRTLSFENITIGDVWLFVGQSNMEYTMAAVENFDEFKKTINNQSIRLFQIPKEGFVSDVRWRNYSEHSAVGFSAMAVYCADMLATTFNNDLPFGMITAASSGLDINSFLKKNSTERGPEKDGLMYKNALEHIEKMPIAGVVWYQGEADAADYDTYPDKLSAFIRNIREAKNQTNYDIPFYIIELPPCFDDPTDPARQYINFGQTRAAAASVVSKFDNVFICPTSDLWDFRAYSNNLHPNNKDIIAKRLVQMILAKEYGFGDPDKVFAPVAKNVYFGQSQNEIIIEFEYGQGITCLSTESVFKGLALINKNWEPIENYTPKLLDDYTLSLVANEPIYIVRYSFETDDVFGRDTNLCGKNLLPCAAFAYTLIQPPVEGNPQSSSQFSLGTNFKTGTGKFKYGNKSQTGNLFQKTHQFKSNATFKTGANFKTNSDIKPLTFDKTESGISVKPALTVAGSIVVLSLIAFIIFKRRR